MEQFDSKYNILLASASFRRRELLTQLGVQYSLVKPSQEEEVVPSDICVEDVSEYLACQKSNAYNDLKDNDLLITADTTVIVDNKILGKPKDYSDAFQMLRLLSGKTHLVVTGVCLRSVDKVVSFSVKTEVTFSKLDDEEIRFYIENFKPYDKAGAYGIQEWIGKVAVEGINGSFYNVVGLPVQRLYRELKKF
ncbi:MAG: septum formation protein Maf [Bacteroidales bacterium]|nr:septum formation protein Maf [Bacteroidales bacterium]MBR6066324.1 septum formation protein Maf [Bacteroidales bacterium]